jgi:hypothetical protein
MKSTTRPWPNWRGPGCGRCRRPRRSRSKSRGTESELKDCEQPVSEGVGRSGEWHSCPFAQGCRARSASSLSRGWLGIIGSGTFAAPGLLQQVRCRVRVFGLVSALPPRLSSRCRIREPAIAADVGTWRRASISAPCFPVRRLATIRQQGAHGLADVRTQSPASETGQPTLAANR